MVAVGVALRILAYARRSALWLDEAATARNILERPLGDLLTVPLDHGQAAPRGFLLLEWLVTRAAGTGELAFRLVPFASGIASVLLFRAIVRRLLSPAGALAALLFFGVGYWFLIYSAETHPYGLDLALSLAALLLTIDLRRLGYRARRVAALAAFGAVAVWLSNGVVLTLFGLGVTLGAIAWRERGLRAAARALWPIAVSWGASAAAATWVAAHGFFPATAEYFQWLWSGRMVPLPRSVDSALWLWHAWRSELALWHGWDVGNPTWTALYPALALIGGVSLLRRRTAEAMLAISVVAAYVLVSMAKQYPYDTRFVLAPMAVLLVGVGESVGMLAAASWGRATPLARALAVLLCLPPVYRVVAYPPPYQWTVTGSYLSQIRDRWRPGDMVYSGYANALEVMYNAPRFGFGPRDYLLGACDVRDSRAVLRGVDALRGRPRVWAIVGAGRFTSSSPEYEYLRAIGVRRDSLPVHLPGTIRQGPAEPFDISTAYLFDLSDSTRLSRATADTYAFSPLFRGTRRGSSRWDCYGVWAPGRRESGIGNRDAGRGEWPR